LSASIKVYNTLTQRKEAFSPLQEGRVNMYVCGVTAYDHAHIGHARAAVVFDVIYRYLKYRGYEVRYVRNFTDVDDKIINRALKEGVSWKEIAERYISDYTDDMHALGVASPTHEPLATDHIVDMIEIIKTLINRGYAYELDGDVYFKVQHFAEYGKLSKKNIDDQLAGARIEPDERKQDPRDFALWKRSKPHEPSWPSPWGQGRPGWHIECSAMSQKYLGETIDIHGGGRDLIFPHHENEIAQAEAATGKPFVRHWIHNGFVNINQEKMSKSLGNIFTIKDVLKQYQPEVVRLFLLSHHYRSPVDFSPENMRDAESGLDRIYAAMAEIDSLVPDNAYPGVREELLNEAERSLYYDVKGLSEKFEEAMDDDFNTALAIGHVFQTVRAINKYLNEPTVIASSQRGALVFYAKAVLSHLGAVLGIFCLAPAGYVQEAKNRRLSALDITVEEIERLVRERNEARISKDWKRADQIRDMLLKKKIILEDGKEQTTWTVR
jgi:cysteinyl-tRNA synthetase